MLKDVGLRYRYFFSRAAAVANARQTDAVTDDAWISAVDSYAERLRARTGQGHHVVSALRAWMPVALCAPLADHEARAERTKVLGADPVEAASSFYVSSGSCRSVHAWENSFKIRRGCCPST
jgi:hypothetical protein